MVDNNTQNNTPQATNQRGKVVALCFSQTGRLYWFKSGGVDVEPGQFVVAETERGPDIAQVVYIRDEMEHGHKPPTRSVSHLANSDDFRQARRLEEKAEAALPICEKKIAQHNLEMKLVRADYTLDADHLTFYFTADGRVDFRELVRDLAQTFHCRIELHQIGVRDEAKMIGGLGPCGQLLCCKRFLREFESVGIHLAKDQDLPLNPEKISGLCGRLMCCLHYEHTSYTAARDKLPEVGEEIQTPQGCGKVVNRNILERELTVKLGEERTVTFSVADLEATE